MYMEQIIRKSILEGHSVSVISVAFHPTASLLATGSDNTVRLYRFSPDDSTVSCSATLEDHSGAIRSVVFHPTLPLLVTGSLDNTTKLWRLLPNNSSATCVATLNGA